MIKLAAVEDHRLLIDGLRAWAETVPDIEIAVVTATVDAFLLDSPGPYDVVLLNPWLRADPDAAANVRRLIGAGQRVLLVDGSADLSMVAATLAAGAHGYLTRDHDAAALARTVRGIAAGETPWSLGPTQAPGAGGPGRPPLSEREHGILMASASGLTLGLRRPAAGHQPRDCPHLPQAGQGQVPPGWPARLHQARPGLASPGRLHGRHLPHRAGRRRIAPTGFQALTLWLTRGLKVGRVHRFSPT